MIPLPNASRAAPGRYALSIQGHAGATPFLHVEPVYIDSKIARGDVFIILELLHQPGEVLGDYRLYDEAAGFALRQPEFTVQLLNRHTHWRYHFARPPEPGTDLGDLEDLAGQFVTRRAMPLTRSVEQVLFDVDKLLPNPSVDHIVPEADRVYSNVFIPTNP